MSDTAIRPATPADALAIAQVRVDAWRTTYKGMMPAAYLASMKVEDSRVLWDRVLSAAPNTTNTIVADVDGRVVGFASALMLPEPKFGLDAELSALYLDRDRQRAGLGTRLFAAVLAAQRVHGATGLLTWVIAGNRGARAFYECYGAELVVEQPFQWDGMDLVEAGYGWRDLPALAAALAAAGTALH